MNKAEFRYDSRITTDRLNKMTANNGDIYFEMKPGTAEASANAMYVCEFLALSSTTAFARIYFTGNSSVTLEYADGKGNTGSDAYNTDAGSTLTSGTSYQCKLSYTPTSFEFSIDDTAVCSIAGDVDWGQSPLVRAFWGGNSSAGALGVYTSTTFSYPTMNTYKY